MSSAHRTKAQRATPTQSSSEALSNAFAKSILTKTSRNKAPKASALAGTTPATSLLEVSPIAMTSHPLRPWKPLVIVITLGLLVCSGCASAPHHAVMSATPEQVASQEPAEGSEEEPASAPAEGRSLFAHMPSLTLSPFFEASEKEGPPLAGLFEGASPLQVIGLFSLLLGLGLVFGSLPAQSSRDSRSDSLSAALHLLSPEALALHSAQRYPTSDGSLTANEAEVLRHAAERIEQARAAEWRRAEHISPEPGPAMGERR